MTDVTYDLLMTHNHSRKFQGCEYVFKFKRKLSLSKKKRITKTIQMNSLFYRNYRKDGVTWYELRSTENQDLKVPPDVSLLISTDFIYMMRRSKTVPVWQNLETLRERIEDDLEFMTAGAFFSYS